ncbi:MAG: TonB-dependent receptor [Bryobacteraceae bacterium]|nr:MAG: TonB-dependent receptor [Bryobacteraceae bacterium]
MLVSSILATGQSPPLPAPEPVCTTITVTAAVAAEAAAHTTLLDARRLESLPGVNLDDRLRMVPGFTLFRRTSSLTANPTTQGVSLRGLGSTGASRTLVVWDGVPVNSPFGGWVWWTRLDPALIERIEVTRGAPTSVFGDRSMGGTIALFSREPARAAWIGYEGGNFGSHQISTGVETALRKGWSAGASLRGFRTDGFFIVPAEARGAVDSPANVRFLAPALRVAYNRGSRRLFLRTDALAEERHNGTLLTRNSTSMGAVALNYWQQAGSSAWNGLLWHAREEYRSTFSSVGAGRLTERLTSRQSVPADSTGGALLWQRSASRFGVLAGADAVHAWGESRETLYPGGFRSGGGSQTQYGLFTQFSLNTGPLRWTAGLRRQDPGAAPAFWMPSAGLTAGARRWRARLVAYRALRAPTLNELYREFRVGNAVTMANPALRPESLRGVETGWDITSGRWRLSVTAFHNRLGDLITNVTRSVTPQLITRQRDNAGAATVRGAEASAGWRQGPVFAEAAWLMADARFSTGERIPQTPHQQGTFLAGWQRRGTSVTAGLRASGAQFEDDRNLFLLPGFAVWQGTVRRRLGDSAEIHAALENAFNRRVIAGYSPTPLLASPRLWRVGLSWRIF